MKQKVLVALCFCSALSLCNNYYNKAECMQPTEISQHQAIQRLSTVENAKRLDELEAVLPEDSNALKVIQDAQAKIRLLDAIFAIIRSSDDSQTLGDRMSLFL